MAEGKTYSCDVSGCGQIFTRLRDMRKHQAWHKGASRLFYCEWHECNFYTLRSKDLTVHIATHTDEKIHECPHTIEVFCPSESVTRDERCSYKTNDRSALVKHRKNKHLYKPRPRAQSNHIGKYEFVEFKMPPSPPVDKHSTRLVCKAQGHAQDAALGCSLPSTFQHGTNEHEQFSSESPYTDDSDSSGSRNATSVIPYENTASTSQSRHNMIYEFVACSIPPSPRPSRPKRARKRKSVEDSAYNAQHTVTYEFIDCSMPPSPHSSEPKPVRKRKPAVRHSKSARESGMTRGLSQDKVPHCGSLASTSQQGADGYVQVNVESQHATDPSAAGAIPETMWFNAHGQTYSEQLDSTGPATPVLWNTHGSSAYVVSSQTSSSHTRAQTYTQLPDTTVLTAVTPCDNHVASYEELPPASGPDVGSAMSIMSQQAHVPYDPTTNIDWSAFHGQLLTAPVMTGVYVPEPKSNHDTIAMAGSATYSDLSSHVAQNESQSAWANVYNYDGA